MESSGGRRGIRDCPVFAATRLFFPLRSLCSSTALEGGFPFLIVEPNNPGEKYIGKPAREVRREAISEATETALGHALADRLGAPLLVPTFPRPYRNGKTSNLYTQSLSREAMLVRAAPLHRLDLQLLAMAEDAKSQIAHCGRTLGDKIMIDGYSASGFFANRFVLLHPDRVAAAAYGGVSGLLMLPVDLLRGRQLNYPLGTFDYGKFTGRSFQAAAFNAVPQFAFMGGSDKNDAVAGRDAFGARDASLVGLLLGRKPLPDRWERVEDVYRQSRSCVRFATYEGKHHGDWRWTDEPVTNDIQKLYEEAAREGPALCH